MRRPWSEAELSELRRRWEAGERVDAIASAMNRGSAGVGLMAWKSGLRGRRKLAAWSMGEVRRLKELWESGMESTKVAKLMGRTQWSVLRMARRQGYKARRNAPIPAATKEEALALMRAGRSCLEVSRRLPVSASAAKRWRDEAGIPDCTKAEHRRATKRGQRKALPGALIAWSNVKAGLVRDGWPEGCSLAESKVLEAMEQLGRAVTVSEIATAVGLKLQSDGRVFPEIFSRLSRMREARWIERVRRMPDTYVLSGHVRELRASAGLATRSAA